MIDELTRLWAFCLFPSSLARLLIGLLELASDGAIGCSSLSEVLVPVLLAPRVFS